MKIVHTLVVLGIASALTAQTPANDDCGGLIDVGVIPYCSNPAQYSNVGATTSLIDPVNNIPDCFNNSGERDVWFQFQLPADGSIVDVVISVFGNVNGNGTLQMPQVAIYRGDCELGGLAELDCAAAPLNVNEVQLEQFGLTPGLNYFLRINDYSGTASPNAGSFSLCIEQYVPDINMGDAPGSQSCSGTLWDSGGEAGDYGGSEDLTFTICPQDFHQCIIINLVEYNLEQGWDFLRFFQGDDTGAPQITQLSGSGSNLEIQVSSNCATIQLQSDDLIEEAGFQLTWSCSPNPCTVPPLTTCDDPVAIPVLPYVENGLSNCFSGNTVNFGPCDDEFLLGNDYVFSYTSPGDECITIQTGGTNTGAGVGVYDNCPNLPNANCIAAAGGGFSENPVINAAFLENPGTYYIVFGSEFDCSTFDILIDTVTCPVILPPASTCDKALDIGGCSNTLPEIIALTPGAGDPDFLQFGINQGCFVDPQLNFSFFYFVAGADGKFGFTVESADPAEASDIDFNVWGPIDNPDSICQFVSNNQPVRSSWSAGADPTGLADIHPVLGTPVQDNYDCGSPAMPGAAGDDFVRRLDVVQGKVYVIMLDDFGNAIVQGGISIDFSGTTDGVLDIPPDQISVSADTVICIGNSVQLNATGGVAYGWSPDTGLSCNNCPNPVATPAESVTYSVQIVTTCQTYVRTVDVKVYDIDLGPDVTVCNNAVFDLNPNPFSGVQYNWTGDNLSCYDCPTPQVSGLSTGMYEYIASMATPLCTLTDTLIITVVPGEAPQYVVSDNRDICEGASVNLGGAAQAGTAYQWSSVPAGLNTDVANPSVTPAVTTIYYLTASNQSCPFSALDSVLVTVFPQPVLSLTADTVICQGESVLLGNTATQAGMEYAWTPADNSLDAPNIPNPLATPESSTVYNLIAFNQECSDTQSVMVTVIPIDISLNVEDSLSICQGTTVELIADVSPSDLQVNWSPNFGLAVAPGGLSASATPRESVQYTATVQNLGCQRTAQVYIAVDSLPDDLSIMPDDTTVCLGSQVLLISQIYEPAEYPGIDFFWSPAIGQQTPDSLYNMVIQALETVVYSRITLNGACSDTAFATVNVIPVAEMNIQPSDTLICPGRSVQLLVTYTPGVEEITWTPSTGLSCTECDNPVATPAGTTTYSVSGDFMGCPIGAAAIVQVRPAPAYTFPSDTLLCLGESIALNQIDDPSATYTWTSTDPAFGIQSAPQPVATPAQNATYFLFADNGCIVRDTLQVRVFSAALSVSNDTAVCKNIPVQLTASGTFPGNFQWSSGQNGQVVNVLPDTTAVYTVQYTYGDNCTIFDSILVTVVGEAPALIFPSDNMICPGDSVLLNSLVVPGAAYSWTSVPAGFTSNSPTPAVTPLQTTTYRVTATLGICSSTSQLVISTSNPQLAISNDTTICAGLAVMLKASANPGGGTFSWTPGGQGSAITVQPAATTSYLLEYAFGDNCIKSDSVLVTVVPNFALGILSEPDTNRIEVGADLELSAEVTPGQSLNGFSFRWEENGLTPVGNGPLFTTMISTNDTVLFYRLTAVSPAGCEQVAVINLIIVQPDVILPNAFTPNGDEDNESFGLIVKEGTATIDIMQIYNRWGQLVFESTDPNARWDGRSDGKEQPSDVYLYIVRWRRADGALQPALKGDLILIR
jgi:gliding motility-associated-like protein